MMRSIENFYHRRRRWILFTFSFLSVSLVGGVVYGWPALRKSLLDDGSALTEKELGAIFTAGAWSTQGGRFFTGVARDRFGTRWVTCVALFCTSAGALGIALSDVNNGLALGASMLFVGLGSGVQLCLQPVASLFPKHAGSILASLSGAFQVSGLIFLMLTSVSDSRKGSFLGFTISILGFLLAAALLLPNDRSFLLEDEFRVENAEQVTNDDPTGVAAEDSEAGDEAGSHFSGENTDDSEISAGDGDSGMRPDSAAEFADKSQTATQMTAIQQMKSWEYAGLLIWFSVLLVPLQYYVGSIGFQLEERGDDDGFYTNIFTVSYASSAVLAPFAGYLADKLGLGVAQALATVLSASSFFILASTQISLDANVVGLVAYSIGRMLVFGNYFTNVGKRFGYTNFGTLAGLGLLISALVSLLQYPLIAAASDGHDVVVNVACGIVMMVTLPYCLWLARRERMEGLEIRK